jgi:hypothetical protein
MRTYCIIDTCILCNLFQIPNKSNDWQDISKTFRSYQDEKKYKFIIPMTVILETGNHIAQNGDGRQKRQIAEKFRNFILEALKAKGEREAVFRIADFPEDGTTSTFEKWLSQFPDYAMNGTGFGDMTLIELLESNRNKNKNDHYFIWSTDRHLSAYSQEIP